MSFDRIIVWGYKTFNEAEGRTAQVSPPPQEARNGNLGTDATRDCWTGFEIVRPGQR